MVGVDVTSDRLRVNVQVTEIASKLADISIIIREDFVWIIIIIIKMSIDILRVGSLLITFEVLWWLDGHLEIIEVHGSPVLGWDEDLLHD